jgi:hypothetical protein
MNVDGLTWRVDEAGDRTGGVAPIAVAPVGAVGNGVRAADGGPALGAPILAAGDNDLNAGNDDEDEYLRQARQRGATVITVDAPSNAEAAVRQLFERHSASNLVTK